MTISSAGVSKTSGCDGCPDAYVTSAPLATTGDVYVRFVPNATGGMRVGLIQDGQSPTAAALLLAFEVSPAGYWEVREAGVWVAEGMAGPTDEFRIGLEGDQVRYYVSGHVVYSRNRTTGTTYRLAAIFNAMGAGLVDAAVATTSVTSEPAYAPVLWTDAANLSVGGSTVTKTSGCDGCPDAFAVSGSQTGSQDAYLEFPAVLDKRIVVGFIPTGQAVSLGAIDYGVGFYPDAGWDVREGGGYRTDGSTGQGDIFRIALEGTRVTYYLNGSAIRTTARRDGISYRAVVLDYSSGGTLGGADLAINSAPVIATPGTPHFALATLGSMAMGAVDAEHDVMTFSASGLPSGLSINAYSGIIAGTPTTAGESAVSVTAADLHGGTCTISFTLVVDGTAPTTPTLTSVSPSSAAHGTQVTLIGTNFGAQANGGYVWLGTAPGTIVNWSATQIVARVDPDSSTGLAQVRLPTGDSNPLALAVTDNASCTYALTPATVTSSAEGATGIITISAPANCAWLTNSNQSWVTLSAVSGVGPSSITYTTVANPGGGRSATVTIGNGSLVVSQDAAQPARPPVLSTLTPDSGVAGNQVTLTGSNFGAAQNGGSVWLGSRQASVVNWSDTLITATVSSGSTTGTAQVRRADAMSNALPFTVVTPIIATVTPASASPGGAITIAGSGFGSAQGAGGAWLGSTAATITSWSDTLVQATVPAGATSGSLQVLQGGVLSNGVAFIVTGGAPHIDFMSPTSGAAGTTVDLYGSGFGNTRSSGRVLIGGAEAPVVSWSEAWIRVIVSPTAITGIVKVQQNDQWSNGKAFTVQTWSGPQITLSPNLVNLVVSESRSLQALDENGAPVSDLTWTSSDPSIVTVSSTPSPVITAVTSGSAVISAGGASVDVTVYAEGTMPEGTVRWSVPGPMSSVADIKVAVPVEGTVADVFAIGEDGAVQAIGADGTVAWTAPPPLGGGANSRPDFQGGLVVFSWDTIVRLHPTTGQATTLYANANDETQSYGLAVPAIHPDGKVLTVDYTCHDFCDGADASDSAAVVGIDVASGTRNFRVPLVNTTYTFTTQDAEFCRNSAGNGTSTTQYHAWPNNKLTVAADGFAYLSYLTYHSTATQQRAAGQAYPDTAFDLFDQMRQYEYARDWPNALSALDALLVAIGNPNSFYGNRLRTDYETEDHFAAVSDENGWAPQFRRACNTTGTFVTRLHLMRVNGEGQTSDTVVKEWTATDQVTATLDPNTLTYTSVELHTGPNDVNISEHIITNADHGALYSWQAVETCNASGTFGTFTYTQLDSCPEAPEAHLTTANGGSVAADVIWTPTESSAPVVEPLLQLEDGSFAGISGGSSDGRIVVFDNTGDIKWAAPGSRPRIALAGGGLITDSGIAYDADGAVAGLVVLPQVRSLLGGVGYNLGSVEQVEESDVDVAEGFADAGNGSWVDLNRLFWDGLKQTRPPNGYPSCAPSVTHFGNMGTIDVQSLRPRNVMWGVTLDNILFGTLHVHELYTLNITQKREPNTTHWFYNSVRGTLHGSHGAKRDGGIEPTSELKSGTEYHVIAAFHAPALHAFGSIGCIVP